MKWSLVLLIVAGAAALLVGFALGTGQLDLRWYVPVGMMAAGAVAVATGVVLDRMHPSRSVQDWK